MSQLQQHLNGEIERRLRALEESLGRLPVRWSNAAPPGSPVRLVTVAENNVTASGRVQLVRAVSASGFATGPAFPAVSLFPMAVNQRFYAMRPSGGLRIPITYQATPATPVVQIEWIDMRRPGVYWAVLEATGGSAGSDPMNRTYRALIDGRTVGSNLAPLQRWEAGPLADATSGLIDVADDETFTVTLLEAFEGVP
jgi:hypothetical protein